MRLTHLEYLLSLKEYGGFSSTAKALYTSQPTISAAIKAFEDEIGCRLMDRNNDGVEFNRMGEEVLQYAGHIVASVANIKRMTSLENRPLVIGTTGHMSHLLVQPVLDQMYSADPDLRIEAKIHTSEEILKMLLDGKIDFGIIQLGTIMKSRMDEAKKFGVEVEELFNDRMFFACREGHPLLSLEEITVDDIVKYPYVSYYDIVEPTLKNIFDKYGFSNTVSYIGDNTALRRYVALTDSFVSQSEMSLVSVNNVSEEKLVPLLVDEAIWTETVCLLHMEGYMSDTERDIAARLEKRGRFLKESYADMAYQ